jgi:hypothetical protein
MIINEITNHISITVTLVALLFTLWHIRVYRWLVIVPISMTIATVSFGLIPICLNDILYDLVFIIFAICLILNRVVFVPMDKECYKCSHYKK